MAAVCEVLEDADQPIAPKSKSKLLPNGQLVSPPLDDLAPFLPEEEFKKYSDFAAGNWDD